MPTQDKSHRYVYLSISTHTHTHTRGGYQRRPMDVTPKRASQAVQTADSRPAMPPTAAPLLPMCVCVYCTQQHWGLFTSTLLLMPRDSA
mmetsp:Transcript_37510/g.94102  ORF Transcript_37510/g.94102 Transcript_37510/m.94102 type:complete len:89 (-) Transcript_37510:254-520(-)